MDELLALYPQNVTQGSPYDTDTQNALTPEYKRIASILGDVVFQAPRRFFAQTVSEKQNTWSFCTLRAFPPAFAHASPCSPLTHCLFSCSKQAAKDATRTWLVPPV